MQEDDPFDDDSVADQNRTSHIEAPRTGEQPAGMRPSEWNNLWYYNGW
jgi:hypothetical protein